MGAAAGGVVVGGSLGWAPAGGVGGRRVDVGLLDAVGCGRRPNPQSAVGRGAPAAAGARWRVREEIRSAGGVSAAPMANNGETTGGLEADPGGAPEFTAAFLGLTSGLVVESRVEIGPTLLRVPWCSMRYPSRRRSP